MLSYFGGSPVYSIGFRRAIDDGVIAAYDVKLVGINLSSWERMQYDEADDVVRETRNRLVAGGVSEEPFGAFMQEVAELADDQFDPLQDDARAYLKAFSRRIDITSSARGKLQCVERLASSVSASQGALFFTRRIEAAEEIAEGLLDSGIAAAAIHSDLTRQERKDLLWALKRGRLKALAAPSILDEGIDVPDIDLAVVMGGSKSRRQMIQRMGRVLRLKADGRKATFIVVFARNTNEDLTRESGAEGCLDMIIESADSVREVRPAEITV